MNLADLYELGITASLDADGGLLLEAPKGALTPELIERIRHHKPGLIAAIQAALAASELNFQCTNPAGKELISSDDAHSETPTDTAQRGQTSGWLLHFFDREPLEVRFAPATTHAEALALTPDAVAAEPVSERITRTANVIEHDELLVLLQAIYADDTDEDRQEAINAALADPGGALACYRAIAIERGISAGWYRYGHDSS